MLKSAFNAVLAIHSRQAQLRRLGASGSPDIYSPCRISPANYFRFLRGPENTTIHGREFVIPVDSMFGQYTQNLTFGEIPVLGTFKLKYGVNETTDLDVEVDDAASIQIALRLVSGLSNILVTGNFTDGFLFVFAGTSALPALLEITDSTLTDVDLEDVETTVAASYQVWTSLIKRGDKIVDTSGFGLMTIDEIVEMPDVGGAIMGFRIRCE